VKQKYKISEKVAREFWDVNIYKREFTPKRG